MNKYHKRVNCAMVMGLPYDFLPIGQKSFFSEVNYNSTEDAILQGKFNLFDRRHVNLIHGQIPIGSNPVNLYLKSVIWDRTRIQNSVLSSKDIIALSALALSTAWTPLCISSSIYPDSLEGQVIHTSVIRALLGHEILPSKVPISYNGREVPYNLRNAIAFQDELDVIQALKQLLSDFTHE